MQTSGSSTDSSMARYERALERLEVMRREEEPTSFMEAVLPHKTDSGLMSVFKYGVGAAGVAVAGAGLLHGASRVFGSSALSGAGSLGLRLGAIAGGIGVMAMIAGGLTGQLGHRYSDDVQKQQDVVEDLFTKTPDGAERMREYPFNYRSSIEAAALGEMRAYDHDGDEVIDISAPQQMVNDERVYIADHDEPLDDADSAITTALPTLQLIDSNGDDHVTLGEMQQWISTEHDTDGNGTLSRAEQAFSLPTDSYDDYRDFAAGAS